MQFLADLLLIAGTSGTGLYCWILARRLRNLSTAETGAGAAISKLASDVDEVSKVLKNIEMQSGLAAGRLEPLTIRAEKASALLEVLIAAVDSRDTPTQKAAVAPVPQLRFKRRRHSQVKEEEVQ